MLSLILLLINCFSSDQEPLGSNAYLWNEMLFSFSHSSFSLKPDDFLLTLLPAISEVPSSDLHLFYQSRIQTPFPLTPNQSRLLKFTCGCEWAQWTSGLRFSPSWKYPPHLCFEFSHNLWLKILYHTRELEEMGNVFAVTNDRWNSLVKTDRIINAVKQNTFKNKDESPVLSIYMHISLTLFRIIKRKQRHAEVHLWYCGPFTYRRIKYMVVIWLIFIYTMWV